MARNAISLRKELAAFKQERIVSTAAQLFYDNGYEATTVDAIASQLHTTKQFIYTYFQGKADILFAVCKSGSVRAMEAAERAAALDADPDAKLRMLIEEFTRVVAQEKVSVAVFMREEKNLTEEHWTDIAQRRRAFDLIVSSILEEGKKAKAFEIGDIQATTRLIAGMVNFIYTWFKPGRGLSLDALAAMASDMAIRMVKQG